MPKVLALFGKVLRLEANEKPLPIKSRNIRLAELVNELGLAERVKSLLSMTGPIPLSP
jgi:hypothetical protein